jgi:hypothetical protein
MAIRFKGSFTVVDDAPNPDLKVAPEGAGSFSFDEGSGSAVKARLAAVLIPLIDAEAAHLAALQAALEAAEA